MTTVCGEVSTPAETPRGYADHKCGHLIRLHKIEGQVRGVTRMVDDERYCIDILTQIAAITRALQEVALGLLDDHIRHCVHEAVHADPTVAGEAKYAELTTALRRALRL
ncbi:metal-sensitive transcriptional regulator [Streptomyces sp. TRM66268-LWL]|uniref:Metal-sensitive transcriptional regulator n=1 Tax=Streptomyces polyasparticus TaxID=2767826 RepID=A0ABR7SGD0_9ACTN|nr:metal-sensitive transcriptional regulator [Streptomyces polyasparticus]MBC9713919.1 metal-sensitive transcriptional regulator [Streptomyces polyasparticus]